MLPLQRKQALITYLARKGAATMKELSDHFGVSEMTIRRDIQLLEQENRVQRSHGGVIYREQAAGGEEPDLATKQGHNADVKERLAQYAANRFVKNGDVLILENGTTVSRMTEHLSVYDQLTLLTNGMDTLSQFRPFISERQSIICCGGMLREASGTFVGPVAEQFFEQYHADTLFLSALGYLPEAGFTDPNLLDTQVKKAMIRSAKKVVMLLDASKFGKRYFSTIAHPAAIDVLVTDSGISEADRTYLEESGVELHIV